MKILRWLLLTDLWEKLFDEIHATNEVVKPTSTKGRWKRCAGTGKSMMNMHKVEGKWFGTCPYCLRVPTLASKRGVAWPHKEMTAQG